MSLLFSANLLFNEFYYIAKLLGFYRFRIRFHHKTAQAFYIHFETPDTIHVGLLSFVDIVG